MEDIVSQNAFRALERVLRLKALDVLPEDPSLTPHPQGSSPPPPVTPVPGDMAPSSGL